MSSQRQLWDRFCKYYYFNLDLGFALDVSRMRFGDTFLDEIRPKIERAFQNMAELERGAIANIDENRMVGHYWLRNPDLAPTPEIADEIRSTVQSVKEFAHGVHNGQLRGANGPFENILVVGIGGSALGPQFVAKALGASDDAMTPYFLDNTDPDGFDTVLSQLRQELDQTLVIVISKSGGTPETRNGMLEVQYAYQQQGLDFARHAVAITQVDSGLDKIAQQEGWLVRFPMWDWVGGRTSELSAVGLLPACLQGIDIGGMLEGAAAMDEVTRTDNLRRNPAAMLAAMWYFATNGRGEKDMVILPYKDRLVLFSKYLQQLVMESLGKELDRQGNVVHQGIAVYGNKGSTDQHAYVQQLRDGVPNFFVTFIEVLRDRLGNPVEVEENITSGDYLHGFLQGTRQALYEKGRDSITITIDEVSPRSVGALIALYERAVGLYAEMIDINAYHQPGVQAGKTAAAAVLEIQNLALRHLRDNGHWQTAEQIAEGIGKPDDIEIVFKVLEHLSSNPGRGILMRDADSPATFQFKSGR